MKFTLNLLVFVTHDWFFPLDSLCRRTCLRMSQWQNLLLHFCVLVVNFEVFVCSQVAVALEKAALSDDYFIKRKLYPNVDFYSGLIYRYAKTSIEVSL